MTAYRGLTHEGRSIEVDAADPAAGMQLAAGRCGPDDWPVTLYATDHTGALLRPVLGGRRGLAGTYPEGQSPEDARELFGPGAR